MIPLPRQARTDDPTLLRKVALHRAHPDPRTLSQSFERISGFNITALIHQPAFRHAVSCLSIQTEEDPTLYVPHGSRHSRSVACFAEKILDEIPDEVKIHTSQQLDLPWPLIDFTCIQLCLLHDIGYPDQMKAGLSKASHAVTGAQLFEKKIEPQLYTFLTELGYERQSSHLVCKLIKKGILYHGADKKEATHHYQCLCNLGWLGSKIPRTAGQQNGLDILRIKQAPIAGRYVDLGPGEEKWVLPYKALDLFKGNDLCDFVVRFADNLDSTRDRLHPHQQRVIKQVFSTLDDHSTPLEDLTLPDLDGLSADEQDFYALLRDDPTQRKYFMGMYAVKDISLSFENGSFKVSVTMDDRIPGLKTMIVEDEFNPRKHCGLRDFFPRRLVESFKSLRVYKKPISVYVKEPTPLTRPHKPRSRSDSDISYLSMVSG